MRRERGNAPIVYAAHGKSSCKTFACVRVGRAHVRRAAPLCFCGDPRSEAAREPLIAPHSRLQRPQTLMNNPTHPPPEKKIAQEQRRRRKRARRGLAHQIRTCTSSQRRGPAPRKRLDAGARTCRSSTGTVNSSYKTAAAFPWLVRAAPICAKMRVLHPQLQRPPLVQPHRAFPCACCSSTHLRLAPSPRLSFCAVPSHAAPFACERFAGSATQPDNCETRPLGMRVAGQERYYGSQVRLSGMALRYGFQIRLQGTALRYGSKVRLLGTALRYGYQVRLLIEWWIEWCLCNTTSHIRARILAHSHLPRPYPRTFQAHTRAHSKPIPTHLPRTRHAHTPSHTLELSAPMPKHFPRPHPRTFHALSNPHYLETFLAHSKPLRPPHAL